MKPDNRPRFGWCGDLDSEPQTVWEKRFANDALRFKGKPYVAVIPIPKATGHYRKLVREFAKAMWRKE